MKEEFFDKKIKELADSCRQTILAVRPRIRRSGTG